MGIILQPEQAVFVYCKNIYIAIINEKTDHEFEKKQEGLEGEKGRVKWCNEMML